MFYLNYYRDRGYPSISHSLSDSIILACYLRIQGHSVETWPEIVARYSRSLDPISFPQPRPSYLFFISAGVSLNRVEYGPNTCQTLPQDTRLQLIDLRGHEARAFIPYNATGKDCPPGVFQIVQGVVTSIEEDFVQLDTGERIPFSYLAIASGSSQPLPAKVASSNRTEACKELQSVQDAIKAAKTIAVIGGGAVGVEIATDIKSYYPEKQVTIVHSRQQLLPHFGSSLHNYVIEKIAKMGIHLQLGERPHLPYEKRKSQGLITDGTLSFSTGEQHFDLIIPCTGQLANSAFLNSLSPTSISTTNNRILVNPTLQLQDPKFPHVFALGDVAETGGPKMARAGFVQADIAQQNIVALIKRQNANAIYIPQWDFEGSIKLTLGKSDWVVYADDIDGSSILWPGSGGDEDLGIQKGWRYLGADYKEAGLV